MKKISSQIAVALVCCILGFMLAYQFKIINIQENRLNSQRDSAEVTVEVERLKNERNDLNKKIDELQNQIKQYQSAAADRNVENKQIVDELNNLSMLTGSVDVEGPGVTITITPQNTFFSSDIDSRKNVITDEALIDLINELRYAGAEAISVNDIRITARTGIKTSSGVSTILIGNSTKISPYDNIVIKAVGDKDKLYAAIVFPGTLDVIPPSYTPTFGKSDNIKINKSNKVINFQYAKPINK